MASDRRVFRRTKRILLVLATVVALTALDFGHLSSGGHSRHDRMGLMTAHAAESFTAGQALLPRTGWTATASDSYSRNPPNNVLDGNRATTWHSEWDGTPVPLPHVITIDMQAVQKVAGLSYLPRQDTSNNGNIGQFAITVSSDGATWSAPVAQGAWADTKVEKQVTFTTVSARYVRLTATTEAGNRGPWSSAAEINLAGETPNTPTTGALPRTGWTAAASDSYGSNPPSLVLDGNAASIWHSKWNSPAAPLPHSITIDMKAAKNISGLTYQPRQDTSNNGNIGQYSIAVSSDGTTFSAPVATGTWTDTKATKTVKFPILSTRFVRLTGSTEAGNRGPWSSAAEINVLGEVSTPAPTSTGTWGPTISFPIVPASAVLLPNNKLLTFAAFGPATYNTVSTVTQVSIYDLATDTVGPMRTVTTRHQMFCTGLALLPDGRVLINGGSSDSATTIYDPFTDTWTPGPLMTIPRAYQGTALLSDGRVFTIGGSWRDHAGSKHGEVWTPNSATGSWRRLNNVLVDGILTNDPEGVFRADNHAWVFGISNGDVFHAGPSRQMNWITTGGDGSIRSAGTRADAADMMNGNAVMYDVGKILAVGGAPGYENSAATSRAYTIDITGGPAAPVTTTRVGDMAYRRSFINSVVLPDGTVVVLGGQAYAKAFTDTGATLPAEIWNPATGRFTILAPM